MHKHRIEVSLTLHSDSNRVSWYVEHATAGGLWELWNEGTSTPWNAASDVSDELKRLLEVMTAVGSPSTNRSSDLG